MKKHLQILGMLVLAVLFGANLNAQTYPDTLGVDNFEDADASYFDLTSWGCVLVAGEGVEGSQALRMGGDPVGGTGIWENNGFTVQTGHVYKVSHKVRSLGTADQAVAPVVIQVKNILDVVGGDTANIECFGTSWATEAAGAYQSPGVNIITPDWQENIVYVKAGQDSDWGWITLWSFNGFGHWRFCRDDFGAEAVDTLAVIDDFVLVDMGPDFVIPSYTVTFVDVNGVVIEEQTVEHAGSAANPAGINPNEWDQPYLVVTSDLTIKHETYVGRNDIKMNRPAIYLSNDMLMNVKGLVEVFDISGRVVMSREAANGTLNVSSLRNGIYIVHSNEMAVKVAKF